MLWGVIDLIAEARLPLLPLEAGLLLPQHPLALLLRFGAGGALEARFLVGAP